MNNSKISNVADPTSSQDVATKNYVDNMPSPIPPMSSFSSVIQAQISGTLSIVNSNANDFKLFHTYNLIATG